MGSSFSYLYALAMLPQEEAPKFVWGDKVNHLIAFFTLATLMNISYNIRKYKISIYLLMYAVFIEVSQYFSPSRSGEILDVLADIIGILVAFGTERFCRLCLCRW